MTKIDIFRQLFTATPLDLHTALSLRTSSGDRALRRTIFLDELKMPKKPDVKPDKEVRNLANWSTLRTTWHFLPDKKLPIYCLILPMCMKACFFTEKTGHVGLYLVVFGGSLHFVSSCELQSLLLHAHHQQFHGQWCQVRLARARTEKSSWQGCP